MPDDRSSASFGEAFASTTSALSLAAVAGRLESAPAALVLDGGHPVAVVSRTDLLGAIANVGGARS